MKKRIVLLVCICMYAGVFAQVVKIKDAKTHSPLKGVIVSTSVSALTMSSDSNGAVDISLAKTDDVFSFSKQGYEHKRLTLHELVSLKYELLLSPVLSFGGFTMNANRWAKDRIETPNRVEKISLKDAQFQNPQTAADLLGTSGYAFIQKSQLGGGSPMLRGYATNRLLMVVDGVRMNTAIFRAGNLQNVISLDANAMESTEIFFGPGAVIYGSDAIGGVMNFNTLQPVLTDSGEKVLATGNALMRTSSANKEMTGHIDFSIGIRKWAFLTSFTKADYGDLRSGSIGGNDYFYRKNYVITIDNKDYMVKNADSGLQVGSKYDQYNFMQKVRFKPNRHWDIDLDFHISATSSYNRYDRLYVMQTSGPYKNKLRWAEWYYGPQKWNMTRLGITHSKVHWAFDNMSITAALQNFEESRYEREFMFRELHGQKENVRALSLNIDFTKKIDVKTSLQYGTELVHNTVRSTAQLTHVITGDVASAVSRYPDGSTWECYGVYNNLKHKLNRKVTLNAGLRYNYYRIKATFDTLLFPFPFSTANMQNGALNGSAGAVYNANRSLQIYANIASGFRAPNIDDMGKVFESTPGYLVVPNPNLKPEKVYNMEIGAVKTFRNFARMDATVYNTQLNDAMVRKDYTFNGSPTIRYLGNPSKIQAIQNVTRIRVYGIQAGLELYYKRFGLNSTISWQEGKEQSPDSLIYYPLRHAAPTFGSTHLTYTNKIFRIDVYAVYNAKMDYEQLALTERINQSYAKDERGLNYSAAWYTLNLKVAANLNQLVSVMFGVENIGDVLYRPYASGINAPGRNFIASLRARF